MTQTTASDLFPVPSSSPSTLSPKVWPGINPKSTDTLRSILKDNHEKWHLYFDPKGFHNHASHSVVALWALGANSETIKETYENDCKHQRPTWTSPEAITAKNFNEHLGDDNYYQAYIDFYTDLVRNKDISTILEEQIFDVKANFIGADKEPEMLNRFLDAIVHPMIHLGYGIEFGLPGMLVEGLASTAVHQASASLLIPRSLWGTGTGSTIDSLTSRLPSALGLGGKAPALPPKNTHALTILARILKDPLFIPHKEYDPLQARNMYTDTLDRCGDALRKYVEEWSFDHSNPKEGERKMEELVWAHAVIYGLGGWSKDKPFNNDFFIMHLVTSSLFLTSILPRLKPASQEMLLRGYFTICLTWWVARGRPGFDIPGFFAADTAHPGSSPASSGKATSSVVSDNAKTPNPWLAIIQTALVVPDDHFPKLHRSLAHFSTLYGTRAAGEPDFVDTELPFAELLDGTLFIRAAGLTNERIPLVTGYDVMGIMLWDHQGFYKEDYKTHKA